MSVTSTASKSNRNKNNRRSGWRVALRVLAVVAVLLTSAGAGAALYLQSRWSGQKNPLDVLKSFGQTVQVMRDPEKFFPGRDRINVLCLGLDRNILRSRDPKLNGMPYTKGARSDVLMVASLDLVNHTASILSIPRDTRVEYPGRGHAKINEAHSRGGIPYTREIVERFLGISIDHHVVIKQEAIEAVVDALGGLKIKVEKDMDYDDNWGQLHVHLKAGEQTLSGKETAGYMRFRYDREGDFGRIRRQQQVIQKLSQEVKNPLVLTKAAGLIGAIREHVQTDLSPEQQLALAHIFHRQEPGSIQTFSLPAYDTATIGGASYVIIDEYKKEAAVDWLIRGNRESMNRLVQVDLRNASGDRELFNQVYDCLRHYGFEVRRGRSAGETSAVSRAVQRTNLQGAARRVMEILGISGAVERSDEDGLDVTLYVGQDVAASAIVANAELWPEIPSRPRQQYFARNVSSTRRRRARDTDRDVEVRVDPVEITDTLLEPPADEPLLDIPGVADPVQPTGEPVPLDAPADDPAPAPAPTPAPSDRPAGRQPERPVERPTEGTRPAEKPAGSGEDKAPPAQAPVGD